MEELTVPKLHEMDDCEEAVSVMYNSINRCIPVTIVCDKS